MRRSCCMTLLLFFAISLFHTAAEAEHKLWVDKGTFKNNVISLAVDPSNHSVVYAGAYAGGLMKSENGGLTWSPTGLIDKSPVFITVDPSDPKHIILGIDLMPGFLRSTDGGKSFTNERYPGSNFSTWVFDPADPKRVYAGGMSSGLVISNDGGKTFTQASKGWGAGLRLVAIDTANPKVVYCCTKQGVSQSIDGGQTWTIILKADPNLRADGMLVDPNNSSILYVYGEKGIRKSSDGGKTWNATNTGLANTSISSMVFDPDMTTTLFAGTHGGGIYVSRDSGGTWAQFNTGLQVERTAIMLVSTVVEKEKKRISAIYAGTRKNPGNNKGFQGVVYRCTNDTEK